MLATGWAGRPGLKILCGGEAVDHQLAELLLDRCGALWNGYGPTEATIYAAVHKVERDDTRDALDASVPIGRPTDNLQLYVLDQMLQPVPAGIPGELYIGGLGVARGYYRRPDLTAEKFLPDPFSDKRPARMYRTGDLVRVLADGRLVYLERLDHQIKIRGYRIELGDIEAVLTSHSAVARAVVTVRQERKDDARLVAYVIAAAAIAAEGLAADLRDFVRERLPDYMLPATYVMLDTFPLTASGKIDRRALPEPGALDVGKGAAFAPPANENEKRVAAIWCELLGVARVGVTDNFFDLGGHSLLLVRLQMKLQDLCRRELLLVELFRYPTVRSQAKFLSGNDVGSDDTSQAARSRAEKQRAALRRRKQMGAAP
jgi:hypothetical protein